MNETQASKLHIEQPKKGWLQSISWVWLVPALALLGSLGLVVQSYLQSDVPIVIEFPDASGIEAGKTQLKFRDVVVGTVEAVEFADGLTHVDVTVNVHRDMAQYIDEETRFWLVQAEVTAQGVSGLGTLLSGAYINAEWDAGAGAAKKRFVADAKPPVINPNAKGLQITLISTETGSVAKGAPVLYKGLKVGTIQDVGLDEKNGGVIVISAFIDEPYDTFVNTGTRFWNASGIDVNLNEQGLNVHLGSLSSLLQGGIAFDTSQSGGEEVTDTTRFDLYRNEAAARDSRFDDDLKSTVTVSSAFEGSLKGLRVGSHVEYRGLRIGEVKDLFIYDNPETEHFDGELLVTYTIQPSRLGAKNVENAEQVIQQLEYGVINEGLRARLQPNGLLEGGLHVELFDDPNAEPAKIIRTGYPVPLLPSVATDPDTLRVAATGVMERISELPVEELMDRTIQMIGHIDHIVANDQTKQIPGSINDLLGNANTFVGSEAVQDLPKQLDELVKTVDTMLKAFEQRKGVETLVTSLENLRTITANVSTASNKVPGLIDDIDAVIKKANDLPLETTIKSVNSVLASADKFISSDAIDDVPGALAGALEQVRATLKELREGGATQNLNKALSSAGNAADAVAKAAASLPELARRLEALANTAQATVGAYGPGSPVNRQMQATISDIRQTVKSLNALVIAIRRNPNSLITGR